MGVESVGPEGWGETYNRLGMEGEWRDEDEGCEVEGVGCSLRMRAVGHGEMGG